MHHFILWLVLSVSSLGLCLVAFAGNAYRVLQSSDTGWLVRTGQYILRTGRLPEHDIFSWTCTDCHWVLYQWLFECAVGAVFNAGGLWLVGLASCILVAVVYLFLLPRQWYALGIPTFVIFAFAGLAFAPHCFFARPQLVSYLCLALFVGILEKYRSTGATRPLWLLPPLTVLWVNCHSFWFIGLAMIAAYCLDGWRMFSRERDRGDRRRHVVTTQVLAVAALCVFINPYGPSLVAYETRFLSEPDFSRLHELRPLMEEFTRARTAQSFLDQFAHAQETQEILGFIYRLNLPFLLFLMLGWSVVVWRRRAVPSVGLWLMATSTVAALMMMRFAPIAAIMCWPFVGLALADLGNLWKRIPAPIGANQLLAGESGEQPPSRISLRNPHIRSLLHLSLVVMVSVAVWFSSFPDRQHAWFTHAGSRKDGIEFLKSLELGPRVFNDGTGGSSLIMADCLPVFIDTRFDLYGKEFCAAWQSCADAKPGWQHYLERMGVTHIFIGRYSPLHRALKTSEGWKCVYLDRACAIWIRKEPLKPFDESAQ